MLPLLAVEDNLLSHNRAFLKSLAAHGFSGDIAVDMATRLAMATDNSIYQVLPQAVVFPKASADIELLFKLASQTQYREVRFAPRGGGTGTDGQALSPGIIIDCSKYMHAILEINVEGRYARVQPGVILDQLNDAVKPYGLFFPPNVAPSSRATLGGVFNTDGCGKGSCLYGRTSQHVLAVESVLSDGSRHTCQEVPVTALPALQQQVGLLGNIYQTVADVVINKQAEIQRQFPKLARLLTGYNLTHVYQEREQTFNMAYLLSGAEGTLAMTTELKLKLSPIPKFKQLVAIKYQSFADALQAARQLLSMQPAAIETVDDKILSVAKFDEIYLRVQPLLDPQGLDHDTQAINLVEFVGDNAADVTALAQRLCDTLQAELKQPGKAHGYYQTTQPAEMEALWDLRKKSVGLLANIAGKRRPVPFVEDTAVPPERLAEFVVEFRQLLDHYGLSYGMFGHVDAGCLHVRPAMDMTEPADAALIPIITRKVHDLVQKYQGVLWSEHGAGFRSQYIPDYAGELYQEMRRIKTVFDPYDQFNPGKIATSTLGETRLVEIKEGQFRGDFDRQIQKRIREEFSKAIECNGNAQCFAYQSNEVMCPSMKITLDRVQSPKGRMTVLREWLRLYSKTGVDATVMPRARKRDTLKRWLAKSEQARDFSAEVYQAMDGCLGCKACASSCPVKVDVPNLRAKFLAHYHTRYSRPVRDYLLAGMETFSVWQRRWPGTSARILSASFSRSLLRKIGLEDLPLPARQTLRQGLQKRRAPRYSHLALLALTPEQRLKTVCLLPDVLTGTYEVEVVLATYDLLTKLGYRVYVLPWRANGKALHNLGMLRRFKQIVERNNRYYQAISRCGLPLLCIEPSLTLCYRDEYAHALGRSPDFTVQLLQEWLLTQNLPKSAPAGGPYHLFSHCSEKALVNAAPQLWQKVFAQFGLQLRSIPGGCCGMAGAYGYGSEHRENSKGIYELSWQDSIEKLPQDSVLASGFSCRCQVNRFSGFKPRHPVQILLAALPAA